MLLSIDVGIRNLAMCLLDEETKTITQWDVSGVPPESDDGLFVSLRKHLDEKPWVLDATTILIEKQPDRNKKMVSVMHFLQSYFIIKVPCSETILYDAKYKIPDIVGAGKVQYNRRKKAAIERARQFIADTPSNNHWIPVFDASRKKDDLADTVMQGLSFINRVEPRVAATKKKATKKITARRPTEHQKSTKYSKSNLAYLWKNKLPCEALEENKRFMKDIKRYWRSLDDFIKDLEPH